MQEEPSSRRRRPKQARSIAKIEAIREAAAQVVARDGAEAATTTRIAKRAGVSVGTLYQYYADRDAVLDDMLSELLARVVAAVQAAAVLPAETPLRDRLEALALAVIAELAPYPGLLRRLDAVPGQRVRERLDQAKEQARALFLGLLAVHPHTLAGRGPALVTRIAADMAEGILWNLRADDEPAVIAAEMAALSAAWLEAPR
jgi:AcrR family transcriptional regulator